MTKRNHFSRLGKRARSTHCTCGAFRTNDLHMPGVRARVHTAGPDRAVGACVATHGDPACGPNSEDQRVDRFRCHHLESPL